MGRLIVTGTGRSGTGYVAQLLGLAGVKCGHEAVFTDITADPAVPLNWWAEWQADCSWMAVPRLPILGTTVFLVVTDALPAVKSLVDLGFFSSDNDYTRVVLRHMPQVFAESTEHDRALAFWLRWNVLASIYADEIVRLEDIDAEVLRSMCEVVGIVPEFPEIILDTVARDHNAKSGQKVNDWSGGWDSFRRPLVRAARLWAEGIGY